MSHAGQGSSLSLDSREWKYFTWGKQNQRLPFDIPCLFIAGYCNMLIVLFRESSNFLDHKTKPPTYWITVESLGNLTSFKSVFSI